MKKYLFAILTAILLCSSSLPYKTYIYVGGSEKKPLNRTLRIYPSGDKILADVNSPGLEQKIYMNGEHFGTKWEMKNSEKKLVITGLRRGNEIVLKGTKKGKPYNEVLEVDDNPWFQSWEVGLAPFMVSDQKELKFWSVNPDMLRLGLFTVVKGGLEEIEVNGVKQKAERIDITMSQLGPKLFHSEMWFEPGTGIMLISQFSIFSFDNREVLKESR